MDVADISRRVWADGRNRGQVDTVNGGRGKQAAKIVSHNACATTDVKESFGIGKWSVDNVAVHKFSEARGLVFETSMLSGARRIRGILNELGTGWGTELIREIVFGFGFVVGSLGIWRLHVGR